MIDLTDNDKISLSDQLHKDAKYVTQDKCGRIDQWSHLPKKCSQYWGCTDKDEILGLENRRVYSGSNNDSWGKTLVDLSTHIPYVKDGILIAVDRRSDAEEYTGGSSSYYKVEIENPTTAENPYIAECNDIIEALGMTYAEGNIFKAVWRRCAARKLGVHKKGYDNGKYDAEKIVFFGERLLKHEN